MKFQFIRRKDFSHGLISKLEYYSKTSDKISVYCNLSLLDILLGYQWGVYTDSAHTIVLPFAYQIFGRKIWVFQPHFCQQLGLWLSEKDTLYTKKFISTFISNTIIRSYAFSECDMDFCEEIIENFRRRTNMYIPIQEPSTIWDSLKAQRRNKIKKWNNFLNFTTVSSPIAFRFLEKNMLFIGLTKSKKYELFKTMQNLSTSGYLQFYACKKGDELEEIVQICGLLSLQNRKILIVNASSPEGYRMQAASVGIWNCIELYAANFVMDFEGSDIPSVAEFFSGFSPVISKYPMIVQSNIELGKKFLQEWM